MKKTLMQIATLTLLAACGPSDNGKETTTEEIPEGQELHFEAFVIEDDSTIEYSLGAGYGFCPKPGELARFEVNAATGQGTAALFRMGDESTDDCLPDVGLDEMVCMVEEEVTLELEAEQLDGLVTAVAAVPTLICAPGYECDMCAVDQLTVGDETHLSNCCSDGNREEWRTRMTAAIAAMTSIAEEAASP